jgi:hypothetical protein
VSASYSIGKMLSGARSAARRKLFRSEHEWLGGTWSELTGGDDAGSHWWTTLENNFVLEASEDQYGGVLVDADRLPSDQAAFARSLAASLSYWKSVVRTEVDPAKWGSEIAFTERSLQSWVNHKVSSFSYLHVD